MAEIPTQKPLKYLIAHYRQPQRTHDDFIKWLVEEHLPLAIPVLKQHGVLGYSLVGIFDEALIQSSDLFLILLLVRDASIYK